MKKATLSFVAVLGLVLAGRAANPVSIGSLLREMTDPDAATYLAERP